ncbi:DUF6773 family protein [Mesobacillus campisalis]|nr:DUF6773 family protein [Mesobacillus campisalis]
MMGFWNKKHKDERVENIKNKIYKEIYILIMVLSFISIAVKFITIEMSLRVVLFEWIVILVSSLYYSVRTTFLGIYSDEVELHDQTSKVKMSKKNLMGGIALGVVLALIFATNSAVNYADSSQQAISYFLLVFFVSFIIYVPLFGGVNAIIHSAAKRKSEQMNQKNLDDREG